MKKLGIILDSFSCIDEKTANDLNIAYLPLQSIVAGKTYEDGINISYKELIQEIYKTKDLKTSLPVLSKIEKTIETMAKTYEHVIYLGINEHLSSTTTTAQVFAKNYPNVHIVQNHFCGRMFVDVALYIQSYYEKEQNIAKTLLELDRLVKDSCIFISPFTSEYLVNGGRLKGLKKFMVASLQKIKIFPIVQYEGKVKFSGLVRSKVNSIEKIIQKTIKFIGGANNIPKYDFRLIHGIDESNNEIAIAIAKKYGIEFSSIDYSSGIIAIHTGPTALAIGASIKLENNENK